MFYYFEIYFLLFIIYSIFGWFLEVLSKYIEFKRFINRGFLIGPYCPIYGIGSILLIFFLNDYKNRLVIFFVFGIIICTILEYMTSLIMEKIFHARWWDYSKKRFNLNGRVCLNTMIPFGLLGVIMITFIHPYIYKKLTIISLDYIHIVFVLFFFAFIIDIIISILILLKLKKNKHLQIKDNTEEIKVFVKETIKNINLSH